LGTCGGKAGSVRSAMVRIWPGGHFRNGNRMGHDGNGTAGNSLPLLLFIVSDVRINTCSSPLSGVRLLPWGKAEAPAGRCLISDP
jgi:hypothetical protein